MSHAALLSGMALANSGLGMAHGVAAALGTHCRVPHGAACALMLPAAIRVNMAVVPGRFRPAEPPAVWPQSEDAGRRGRSVSCTRSNNSAIAWACRGGSPRWASRGSRFPPCQEFPRREHERQSPRTFRRRTHGNPRGPAMILSAGLTPAWQQIMVFRALPLRRGEPGLRSALARAGQGASTRASPPIISAGRASRWPPLGGPPLEPDRPRTGRAGRAAAVDRHPVGHAGVYHDPRSGHRRNDRAGGERPAATPDELDAFRRAYAEEAARAKRGRHHRLAAGGHAEFVLSRTGRADALPGGARFSRRGAAGCARPRSRWW